MGLQNINISTVYILIQNIRALPLVDTVTHGLHVTDNAGPGWKRAALTHLFDKDNQQVVASQAACCSSLRARQTVHSALSSP